MPSNAARVEQWQDQVAEIYLRCVCDNSDDSSYPHTPSPESTSLNLTIPTGMPPKPLPSIAENDADEDARGRSRTKSVN
jgi:hypothetical protein